MEQNAPACIGSGSLVRSPNVYLQPPRYRSTIRFEVVRARHQVECQIDDNFTRFDEHSVGVTSVRNLLVISALVFVTSALKFWSVGLKGSRAAGSNFVASTLSHNHQRPAG